MSRVWRALLAVVVLAAAGTGAWWVYGRRVEPNLPTADVTRGAFKDVVEIRGEVRPVRSTLVLAPLNAGELTVLKIAKNGTAVKAGDIVGEFDAMTMRRTIQEKQSDLRSALAGFEQLKADSKISLEEKGAAVRRAQFDVAKAELSVAEVDLAGSIENQKSKLALADARQRLHEMQAAEAAAKLAVDADFAARTRQIDKIKADLAMYETAVSALVAKAPIDGTVNILPNYRSASMMGMPAEFKPGDKTYAGAAILELPDLTSVYLVARLDETDRGLLKLGQTAAIKADAIADRDYQATISAISLLARMDSSGGWPPTKQFDLKITFTTPDERLRPGMSAVARIGVGEIPDVLIVPTKAVFADGGRPVVYRFSGREFVPVPVEIIRRGRDQTAIKGPVNPGDRVSLASPVAQKGSGS
ncbi:MAG TPA: efflux RND transporter periplasmic adaptor subunit [Vicinamibacterales bacterium]|nr:efflux RND transporter periplasmic adaptor subunit [Vicinamibacterales bacterium]